ncbi:unnamed protein product [Alopecurus aequalis]
MAEAVDNIWELIPTDVLSEVLLCLPHNCRRQSRLVCRLWRDAVDTSRTEMRSRPKTLVTTSSSVRLVADLPQWSSSHGSAPSGAELWTGSAYNCTELWTGSAYNGMSFVGTCNGLICMCHRDNHYMPLILSNPVTGETLVIPPAPVTYMEVGSYSYLMYSFAYHPTTGRYKIVHVPHCFGNRVWVFTLGEKVWREVATGCHKETYYDQPKGIVSIDGAVCWAMYAVHGMEAMVMFFDLDSEHIESIRLPLPNVSSSSSWHLTEAHGRLGVAFTNESSMSDNIDVWVMEHATAGQQRMWSRLYNIHMQKPRVWQLEQHELTQPYFTHDGEYILTMRWNLSQAFCILYKHKLRNDGKNTWRGVVEIDEKNEGTVVAYISASYHRRRTFAYFETNEPLSVYRCS